MTKDDPGAWTVARRALDHHEAVAELTEAMPDAVVFVDDTIAKDHMAQELAAELARRGLVLVRMDVEQARDFFSRKEDV